MEPEISIQNTNTEMIGVDPEFSQVLEFFIEEDSDDESQLLSPGQVNNNTIDQSVPREIITSINSAGLQSECLRPLIAGTFNDEHALLLKLQFQFNMLESSSWFSRVQSAIISVVLEDAPGVSGTGSATQASDQQSPSVMKTYPGPEGWNGPIAVKQVSNTVSAGVGISLNELGSPGANARVGKTSSMEVKRAATVKTMRRGERRNELTIRVKENPIDADGIPSHLIVPLIVTHNSRRFSMRVTVQASFGFWRGKLAKSITGLGRTDDPLYFDPNVLRQKIETQARGLGGVRIIEEVGSLDDVDLQLLSSLS
jgi:hypothetical protein